ncbi:MAG TPA: HAMP domain-containing sensor histidine kinase [Streptosporangiaceae bacterium]
MSASGPAGPAGPAAAAGPRISQAELAWLLLAVVCLVTIVMFPAWQVFPLDTIWLSLALLYGFLLWPNRRLFLLTAVALATTVAAASSDALRHLAMAVPVRQMPLVAVVFIVLAWQAHRRIAAQDRAKVDAESARLVRVQRQFLQDASHQLRTPITIALGHAELLAAALGDSQQRDVRVVVGELQRLKKLSERLLLVAAAENPDFLVREPADIDMIVAELFLRWQTVAPRRWQLGHLDPVTVPVDADRLGLALDALVENAVRHTGQADEIALSVTWNPFDQSVVIAVADTGSGIAAADLPHVFERFRTSGGRGGPDGPDGPGGPASPASPASPGGRGTGLGLALVRAVATGHSGDVSVRSVAGAGSTFELVLPAAAAVPPGPATAPGPPPLRPGAEPGAFGLPAAQARDVMGRRGLPSWLARPSRSPEQDTMPGSGRPPSSGAR